MSQTKRMPRISTKVFKILRAHMMLVQCRHQDFCIKLKLRQDGHSAGQEIYRL